MDNQPLTPQPLQAQPPPIPPQVPPPAPQPPKSSNHGILYMVLGGILVVATFALTFFLISSRSTVIKPPVSTQITVAPSPTITPGPEVDNSNPFEEAAADENPFATDSSYTNPFDTAE